MKLFRMVILGRTLTRLPPPVESRRMCAEEAKVLTSAFFSTYLLHLRRLCQALGCLISYTLGTGLRSCILNLLRFVMQQAYRHTSSFHNKLCDHSFALEGLEQEISNKRNLRDPGSKGKAKLYHPDHS